MNKNQLQQYLKLLDIPESKPSVNSLTNTVWDPIIQILVRKHFNENYG